MSDDRVYKAETEPDVADETATVAAGEEGAAAVAAVDDAPISVEGPTAPGGPGEVVGRDADADASAGAEAATPADVGAADVDPAERDAAIEQLKPILEALIFASPDPLSLKALCKLLDSEPKEDIDEALRRLRDDYQGPRGLQLVEVAGGYQIVTRPELHDWVRRLFHERTSQKLSVQALETLAVIAYRQPVTAPEITEIRGVNTSGVLSTLLERKLVKIVGRKQVVGRPFMYATTREFLDKFGLRDLADLPKVEDMADILGFDPPSGLAEPAGGDGLLPFDAAVGDAGETRPSLLDGADDASAPPTDDGVDPGPSVH